MDFDTKMNKRSSQHRIEGEMTIATIWKKNFLFIVYMCKFVDMDIYVRT